MTFWELLGVVLSSAGLYASVLGTFLTHAARRNGEATRALIRELSAPMDQRAEERHREVLQLFDRMDQRTEQMDRRADERHREVIEAISALRAT